MKNSTWIILLSIIFLMPACLSDGTSRTGGTGGIEPLSLDGQVITCEENSDCTVVELGCCDSCNGGWSASVNKDYEEDVIDRNHDTCTGKEVCTEMWCGYEFARCENNICTSRIEDWQACEADEDCTVVELGCCDHCNGGRTTATHKDFAEEIKEIMGDECEEDHACTLIGCAPVLARCNGGRCEGYEDSDWGIAVEPE